MAPTAVAQAIALLKMDDGNSRGAKRGRDELSSSDTEEMVRNDEPAVGGEEGDASQPVGAVWREGTGAERDDRSRNRDILSDLQTAFAEVSRVHYEFLRYICQIRSDKLTHTIPQAKQNTETFITAAEKVAASRTREQMDTTFAKSEQLTNMLVEVSSVAETAAHELGLIAREVEPGSSGEYLPSSSDGEERPVKRQRSGGGEHVFEDR